MTERSGYEIAVVGLWSRLPGSEGPEQLWRNIRDARRSITELSRGELVANGVPASVQDQPGFVPCGGVLEDAEGFDAEFFGYAPREAEIMDPQHRMFLECSWAALEHAGYDPMNVGALVGVYGSCTMNTYLAVNLLPNRGVLQTVGDLQTMIGNDKEYLATRVSYKLGLEGPSFVVQSGCSSSLLAVHVACQQLLSNECDMAIAGGSSLRVPHAAGYIHHEGGTASPDGHCRAFDEHANGTVIGSGVGVVVLKRLADALTGNDDVLAVIRGSAVGNDGARKTSFAAPSVAGQASAIVDALQVAGVSAETVELVEAHGTGTALGDPVEVAALSRAFAETTTKLTYCVLGSIKPNIGHLDAAAGVASLIKAILSLRHATFPPAVDFVTPNSRIDFARSPFFVATKPLRWASSEHPRRAAVNSLGIGGTNVHVILEEPPPRARSEEDTQQGRRAQSVHALPLSARTPHGLAAVAERLAEHLSAAGADLELADVAYTLQHGRHGFAWRAHVVASNIDEAIASLHSLASRAASTRSCSAPADLVMMFSGQGAQHVGMAHTLYLTSRAFADAFDRCADAFADIINIDLRSLCHSDGREADAAARLLAETRITQPALFAVEWSLAQWWAALGVRPRAVLGHSIGEISAAAVAGALSFEQAVELVAVRAEALQRSPPGAMLGVALGEQALSDILPDDLDLAAVNAHSQCSVAGHAEAIEAFRAQLDELGVASQRLKVARAFHSRLADDVLALFEHDVAHIDSLPLQIDLITTLDGSVLLAGQTLPRGHWCAQMRRPVRFAEALRGVREHLDSPVFLEVGPGASLTPLARGEVGDACGVIATLPSRGGDARDVLSAAAELWSRNMPIDWSAVHCGGGRRAGLPTYPFDRRRYWLEAPLQDSARCPMPDDADTALWPSGGMNPLRPRPLAGVSRSSAVTAAKDAHEDDDVEVTIARAWSELLGIEHVAAEDNFFDLGGQSLAATQLIANLRELFSLELQMATFLEEPTVRRLGAEVRRLREAHLTAPHLARATASPARDRDLDMLLEEIEALPDADIESLLRTIDDAAR